MGIYRAKRDRLITVSYTDGSDTFEVDFRVLNKNDDAMTNDETLMEYAIVGIRGLEYEAPDGTVVTEDDFETLKMWVCGDIELIATIQKGYYDFLSTSSRLKISKRQH